MKRRHLGLGITRIASVLLVMFSSPLSSEGLIDETLRSMGFNTRHLSTFTPEFKQHMAQELGKGWVVVSVAEASAPLQTTLLASTRDPTALLISKDDFRISTVISKQLNPPPGQERYYIASNWRWQVTPWWKLTDKVGLAWNGPFQADQQTLRSYYVTHGGGCSLTFSETVPAEQTPGAGFGFDVDILYSYGLCALSSHSGWIEGYIYKMVNTSEPHSATVVSRYYHQQICITSGTLGFSKSGPAISLDGSSCYEPSGQPGVNFTYHGS